MKAKQVVSAGVVTFRKVMNQFEVLLLQYSGYYGHPMGHIEEGETIREAAMRELKEETNLDLKEISNQPTSKIQYSYSTPSGIHVDKTVHFFTGLVYDDQKVKISYEHSDYKWADPEKAIGMVKYENAKEVIKSGFEWLNKNFG